MRTYTFILIALLFLTTGCSIIPQDVEFFQKKVKEVPTLGPKENETLKQTVDLLNKRATDLESKLNRTEAELKIKTSELQVLTSKTSLSAQDTVVAALNTFADNTVITSATATAELAGLSDESAKALKDYVYTAKLQENSKIIKDMTGAVANRVGPPISPADDKDKVIYSLINLINKQDAKQDRKLDEYKEDQAPLVGKKVEGTGLIQMGYFTYLLVLFAIGAVIWTGLKVWSAFNPLVGVGVKVTSGLASKAVSELTYGGERFKNKVKEMYAASPAVSDEILKAFKESHQREQSTDTQNIVKQIT